MNYKSWLAPFTKIFPLTMDILTESDIRPMEWFLAITLIWWGIWFFSPWPSMIQVDEYLAEFAPLPLWAIIFIALGILHLWVNAQCYMVNGLHDMTIRCRGCRTFALGQTLLWLTLIIIFSARGFFVTALVFSPIYFLAAAWTFIRHSLRDVS